MQDNIIIALIAGIFGSIITWFAKLFYDRNRERFISEQQHKQKRYKSTIIFMKCYLDPKNVKFIQDSHPYLKTKSDIKDTLKAEYNEMLLYAPDDVVRSLKNFILKPSENKFLLTIQLMRKDLWGKKSKLKIKDIKL